MLDRLFYSIFRIAVGIPLLVGGTDKIIALVSGDRGLRDWLLGMFAEEPVPDWIVTLAGTLLPFMEFATGFLVVLGIFPRIGATLGLLTFGMFLFGAELTHYVEGQITEIIQQMLFTLGFFLVALYAKLPDPLRIYPRRPIDTWSSHLPGDHSVTTG